MNPEQEEFRKFFPGIKKEDDILDEVLIDESTCFSIRLRKVSTKEVLLLHNLEKCYDWTLLKQFILRDLKKFHDSSSIMNPYKFVNELRRNVNSWLHSFNGWGLKYYLLEGMQKWTLTLIDGALCVGLKEYKKFSELDPESSFKSFFDFFKVSKCRELEEMFEDHIVADSSILWSPRDAVKWRKTLKIEFDSLWNTSVHVEFEIEKIQPPIALVDLAAKVIARGIDFKVTEQMKKKHGPMFTFMDLPYVIRHQGLPANLLASVRNKIKDSKWESHNVYKKSQSTLDSEDILESMLPQLLYI